LSRNDYYPVIKTGRNFIFFEEELIEWIERGKKKALSEINDEVEANYRTKSKSGRQ
jgi:hypothetical protein